MRTSLLLTCAFLCCPGDAVAGPPKERDWEVVELTGEADDYWYKRYYRFYYWAEDFSFVLKEEGTGKVWRIISREPTPAYKWRMGPTYPALAVDWKAKPKVKVLAVKAVDRIPEKFHDFKLDEKDLATALIVRVETKPGTWQDYYVNNWFHIWGKRADAKVYSYYADKDERYHIYGFARAQAAPYTPESKAIMDKNKDNPSLMFRGRVKTAKETDFGYQIELIDLIGRNTKSGGELLLLGDAKGIPLLEAKK
jgi:hypothetical protein